MKGSLMNANVKRVIEESVASSYAGTRDFPTHVRAVAGQGVESYRVDFREHVSTYFLQNGESHTVNLPSHPVAIADGFDEPAVVAAIRSIQQGQIEYPEFIDRILRAGCVGYIVWLAGRHVAYFGRRGETHIEPFPSQPS
ncbi:MAG TPA: hypothetical protein VKY73_17875 [Polyangiaceae bacterium]|nr:hypothetical protein [Polyangiaceae bacterium]